MSAVETEEYGHFVNAIVVIDEFIGQHGREEFTIDQVVNYLIAIDRSYGGIDETEDIVVVCRQYRETVVRDISVLVKYYVLDEDPRTGMFFRTGYEDAEPLNVTVH